MLENEQNNLKLLGSRSFAHYKSSFQFKGDKSLFHSQTQTLNEHCEIVSRRRMMNWQQLQLANGKKLYYKQTIVLN